MLTKGKITEVRETTLMVRLPVFESAGNNNPQIVECTVCYNPGNLNGYKIDDVVWVGFENNQIHKPVVLGKLYLGTSEESSNFSKVDSLNVSGSAVLPANTVIGNLDFNEIKNISGQISQLDAKIDQVKVDALHTDIPITDLR